MRTPPESELRQLVHKCWMTHDGMWFAHTAREFGIDAANRLNKAAIRSLAAVEIKRVMKACGLGEIRTFEDIKIAATMAFNILAADFMDVERTFPRPGVLRLAMGRCFALEGMKRIGVADQYECGIYWRADQWFKSLGIEFKATPEITGCLQLTQGECYREYEFNLPIQP